MDEANIKIQNQANAGPKRFILAIGLSCLAFCVSFAIMVTGFVQAYSCDASVTPPGAPPVSVMSGVVRIAMFLELVTTVRLTKPETIMSTYNYRLFYYVSAAVFGFLSMAFYAAPVTQVESLASVGCAMWIVYASCGAYAIYQVKKAQEVQPEQHARHCCGIGCCKKSGFGMCCRWTLWTFAFLFFVQASCILSENVLFLKSRNTNIELVQVSTGFAPITLAMYCDGIQAPGDPMVLLEAGGGSGMAGMIGVLMELKAQNMRACAYDRAGYGFSQSGLPYMDLDSTSFQIMQALEQLGERGPYVCAGHSAGGTICRNMNRLYPANVSGIILMDAYCNAGKCNIEEQWNNAMGLPNNTYASIYGLRVGLTDAMRYFTPFALIRAFIAKPEAMDRANYGGNVCWNSQYTEFRPSPKQLEQDATMEAMWWQPGNAGNIPILVATGGAVDQTCEEKKLVDNECLQMLKRQNRTLEQLQLYGNTSAIGYRLLDCHDCDHGYVQTRPALSASYVMQVVHFVRFGVWPAL